MVSSARDSGVSSTRGLLTLVCHTDKMSPRDVFQVRQCHAVRLCHDTGLSHGNSVCV